MKNSVSHNKSQKPQETVKYLGTKVLLLLLMCSACAGLVFYDPKPPHTHRFSHKQHTVEVGMECNFCHYAVESNGVEIYGMLPCVLVSNQYH